MVYIVLTHTMQYIIVKLFSFTNTLYPSVSLPCFLFCKPETTLRDLIFKYKIRFRHLHLLNHPWPPGSWAFPYAWVTVMVECVPQHSSVKMFHVQSVGLDILIPQFIHSSSPRPNVCIFCFVVFLQLLSFIVFLLSFFSHSLVIRFCFCFFHQ